MLSYRARYPRSRYPLEGGATGVLTMQLDLFSGRKIYIVELTYPCTRMFASAGPNVGFSYGASVANVMACFAIRTKSKHCEGPQGEECDCCELHNVGLDVVKRN